MHFGVGVYKLIDWSQSAGAFSDTADFAIHGSAAFDYAVVAAGGTLDPAVGGGTVPPKNIYLEVLPGSPTFVWMGSAAPADWDTTSANWTSAGAGTVYSNGSNVIFDDSATGATDVTVSPAAVAPKSIAFNNGSRDYTLGGAPISVTVEVTKSQGGNVVLNDDLHGPLDDHLRRLADHRPNGDLFFDRFVGPERGGADRSTERSTRRRSIWRPAQV